MVEEIFTPCVQTCLNHAEDMFTLRLHHVYRHVYIMLEDMFTCYLRNCLNDIRRHIYSMWDDMFTPCWKTCLHIVWNMFTQYSKTYLYRVERNSYSMLEDLILLGLIIMHLHNVWRQFSIIFENMLTHFLETFFLHHVRRYVMLCMKTCWHKISSTFEDVLIQCWQT